jgi:hypothetical protein
VDLLTHYGENFTNNSRENFYILIGFPLEEVYDPSFSELDLEARTHEGNFWLENHDTGEIYFGLNLFYSRKQANNLYYTGSKYSTRDTHCCIHCLNSFEQCSLFDNKKISFIDKVFRFIDSITNEERIIIISQKETENIFDEALDKLTLIHHHFRSEHNAVRTECPHRKSKRINDAYEFAIKHRFY